MSCSWVIRLFQPATFVHRAVDAADLIINIGHDVVEKPPFFMQEDGVKVIHLNFSSAAKSIRSIFRSSKWSGISPTQSGKSAKGISPQEVIGTLTRFLQVKAGWRRSLVSTVLTIPGSRSIPNGWLLTFAKSCPRTASSRWTTGSTRFGSRATIVPTLRIPSCSITLWPRWAPGYRQRWQHDWFTLRRKVMAICGDGGFMMNSQELETAVRLNLQLVVLVLRDDAYGMIKWKQSNMGFATLVSITAIRTLSNTPRVMERRATGWKVRAIFGADGTVPCVRRCPLDRSADRLFRE